MKDIHLCVEYEESENIRGKKSNLSLSLFFFLLVRSKTKEEELRMNQEAPSLLGFYRWTISI